MPLGKRIAAAFQMDEATWKRHANPRSVWSRTAVLPLLVVAGWSRVWIGWWALLPGALGLLWAWLNPRFFGPPDRLDSWASRSVLGERLWINRDEVPVPARHRRLPTLLNALNAAASLVVVWGVVDLSLWPTVLGAALVYTSKFWFLDRMVWLYEDMR